MKKRIYTSILTLGLFIALTVMPANAQFENAITVSIPFEFAVGEKTMPAGEYTIKSLVNGSLQSRLLIRSKDGRNAAAFPTWTVEAKSIQKEARLTFNRYGDQYFLTQVWAPDTNIGRELPKSGIEARIANNAANKDRISIAASKR
jgi:hypothetical protein